MESFASIININTPARQFHFDACHNQRTSCPKAGYSPEIELESVNLDLHQDDFDIFEIVKKG
ncbi:hypothetical protein [Paraburkholderia sp. J7]|uniref:hypothetical protein n=1 Tax=Paraburkholderia sp. J7 TaxID=2805438 RepID=UPI002AB787AD|nr:hypothetical protein [Paraburkholderia sp. J7]